MSSAAATTLDLDDESYDSSQDEDFQPDEAAADDISDLSSNEDDIDSSRPTKKRKIEKSATKKDDEDLELASGDEATIRKAKEKSKRKGAEDDDVLPDEEPGEGLFVRTRSMRMKEKDERKPLAKIEGATIDVDAIWQKMISPDADKELPKPKIEEEPTSEENQSANGASEPTNGTPKQHVDKLPSEELIKIKRTYKFAGEVITEEKLVPKDSAEAKLYLEGNDRPADAQSEVSVIQLRRPLRRVSRFDPNPVGSIQKSWEKQAKPESEVKGPKLNTVEKSRLDWAQYVDAAGIKDELNVHAKAKEGYLGRMEFLSRVDAKREEERRNLRLKAL